MSFKSTCNFDDTYFPYDEHRCKMIFGSLTSDVTLMDIQTEEKRKCAVLSVLVCVVFMHGT